MLIVKFKANPVLIAFSIQVQFSTGSIPGIPESIKLTFSFGSEPNKFGDDEIQGQKALKDDGKNQNDNKDNDEKQKEMGKREKENMAASNVNGLHNISQNSQTVKTLTDSKCSNRINPLNVKSTSQLKAFTSINSNTTRNNRKDEQKMTLTVKNQVQTKPIPTSPTSVNTATRIEATKNGEKIRWNLSDFAVGKAL